MNALTEPAIAAPISPINIATGNGMPASIQMTMIIGARTKTDPTERSNSPDIIRMVTPMTIRAISGMG